MGNLLFLTSYGKGREELSPEERLKQVSKTGDRSFKKIQRVGKEVIPESFVELVDALKRKFSVTWLCDYFDAPRSSYYRWTKKNSLPDTRISRIGELCKENNFTYIYREMTFLLHKEMAVNHKVVQQIMQTYSWNCRVKTKK